MDEFMGWCLLPLAAIAGFLLPGFFLAHLLRSPETLVVSFCLSVLVLFQGIFWFGVLGVHLGFGLILSYLLTVSLLAALAARRWSVPSPKQTVAPAPERSL